MRGLERIARARVATDKRRAELQARLLVDDEHLGRSFRAGDKVQDTTTGERGHVERVEVRRVIIPVTRGS